METSGKAGQLTGSHLCLRFEPQVFEAFLLMPHFSSLRNIDGTFRSFEVCVWTFHYF